MPYFDDESLRRLREGFDSVPARTRALTDEFLGRPYVSVLAREHAHHGVCRRLNTLARCIAQIYSLLPPDRSDVPPRDTLVDATIFIQAFVFNAYGVLDNLAFVWVNERNIRKCSATIWMGKQRQSGRPFWRSRRRDDCRGATITQAVFS
jgi:hypothetical protein